MPSTIIKLFRALLLFLWFYQRKRGGAGGGGLIQVPLILIYIEVLHSQPPFLRHAPFGLKREWVKEQAVSHGIASSKHKLEHKRKL